MTASDEAADKETSLHQGDQQDLQSAATKGVGVSPAEFPALGERQGAGAAMSLDRFYDVAVRVWAELGQVTLPIGDMLKLGEGAVVKLSRPVSAPVDLMAQGVRFAIDEVVIVDDCFAVRITEIESDRAAGE